MTVDPLVALLDALHQGSILSNIPAHLKAAIADEVQRWQLDPDEPETWRGVLVGAGFCSSLLGSNHPDRTAILNLQLVAVQGYLDANERKVLGSDD